MPSDAQELRVYWIAILRIPCCTAIADAHAALRCTVNCWDTYTYKYTYTNTTTYTYTYTYTYTHTYTYAYTYICILCFRGDGERV